MKLGRPKGARDHERVAVVAVPARCPRCRATLASGAGKRIKTQEIGGIAPDGQPYTAVVWRSTRCPECGQYLTIRTYETKRIP